MPGRRPRPRPHPGAGPAPAHLLLLQAEHRAAAAAAPLPLEGRDLLRLDPQDLLLLLVLQLQLLGVRGDTLGAGPCAPLCPAPRPCASLGSRGREPARSGSYRGTCLSPSVVRPTKPSLWPRASYNSPRWWVEQPPQGGRATRWRRSRGRERWDLDGAWRGRRAPPPSREPESPTLTRCCRLLISASRRRFCSVSSRSRRCSCPCCWRMSCTFLSSSCSRFSLWADSDTSRSVACFFSFSTWDQATQPPLGRRKPGMVPGT